MTRRLFARHGIATPLEPYHAKNLERRTPQVVARVASGQNVALVSDAGTPGISDPGARLVDACLADGLVVEVLPGPSAIVTALVASGLPTHAFYFGGFLPRKAGDRTRVLESLARLEATLVFYESPRRVAATLVSIAEALPGRRAVMARELTKVHEEVVRGQVEELARDLASRELKGEAVLLVGPPDRHAALEVDLADLKSRVDVLVSRGSTRKDAVMQVARETGLPRNTVYTAAVGRIAKA